MGGGRGGGQDQDLDTGILSLQEEVQGSEHTETSQGQIGMVVNHMRTNTSRKRRAVKIGGKERSPGRGARGGDLPAMYI